MIAKAKAVVEPSRTVFTPGHFELIVPEKVKIDVKEFKLNRDASRIFTFGGPLSVVSKTLGPFRGEIRFPNRELIATLDDVRVTVTRMTDQVNRSFLMCTLEYLLTSHGWRTGDARFIGGSSAPGSREPYGASESVHFQNSAGGTMNSWGIHSPPFELRCTDRSSRRLRHHAEHNFLGWFDDWAIYSQSIDGSFFRC